MIFQLIIHILFGVIAYLIGSVQFGIISGKLIQGIDIREHGSKSTGATNVGRTLGVKIATVVALLDIGKGFLIVLSLTNILNFFNYENSFSIIIFGTLVILGHCWPIFYKFKGPIFVCIPIFCIVFYQIWFLAAFKV